MITRSRYQDNKINIDTILDTPVRLKERKEKSTIAKPLNQIDKIDMVPTTRAGGSRVCDRGDDRREEAREQLTAN